MTEIETTTPVYMITSTCGPKLRFRRNVTRSDYISICNDLSKEFSKVFGGDYVFEPEPIKEGGFVLTEWPGKKDKMYKSLRHLLGNGTAKLFDIKWPWIGENVLDEWEKDDSLLIPKTSNGYTTLKALEGAPVWTIKEIGVLYAVFSRHYITVSCLPKRERLSQPLKIYITQRNATNKNIQIIPFQCGSCI